MLQHISWLSFAKSLAVITACYYLAVFGLLYRKETFAFLHRVRRRLFLVTSAATLATIAKAQDPNAGISQANTLIRGMFDTGTQLMYAIGAVLGLVGAVKTYKEWNAGHQQEAYRAATGWLGSSIFLVVVAAIIKSFFGL